MARFSFRKQGPEPSSEDEGLPPLDGDLGDSGSGAAEPSPAASDEEGGGRTRRLIILAGIGVLLVGGAYLANQLFLAPAPAPPVPIRPAVPLPQAKAPAPPAAQKPAPSPAAPGAPTAKAPTSPGPPAPSPAPAVKPAAPATPAPAVKTPTPPASAKVATPQKAPPAPSQVEAKATIKPEAPKAAAAPKPAQAVTYSLQVGAMVVESNAQNLRRRLDESGFPATIRKGTAFVSKHVVTVGDPSGKREAEELARRLNVDGFPSQLLDVDGKFTPQIGAFFNLDEAIDLARELQKKNYRPKISSSPANTEVFQVRHGRFDSRAAALKRGKELKAKGFTYIMVRN